MNTKKNYFNSFNISILKILPKKSYCMYSNIGQKILVNFFTVKSEGSAYIHYLYIN